MSVEIIRVNNVLMKSNALQSNKHPKKIINDLVVVAAVLTKHLEVSCYSWNKKSL